MDQCPGAPPPAFLHTAANHASPSLAQDPMLDPLLQNSFTALTSVEPPSPGSHPQQQMILHHHSQFANATIISSPSSPRRNGTQALDLKKMHRPHPPLDIPSSTTTSASSPTPLQAGAVIPSRWSPKQPLHAHSRHRDLDRLEDAHWPIPSPPTPSGPSSASASASSPSFSEHPYQESTSPPRFYSSPFFNSTHPPATFPSRLSHPLARPVVFDQGSYDPPNSYASNNSYKHSGKVEEEEQEESSLNQRNQHQPGHEWRRRSCSSSETGTSSQQQEGHHRPSRGSDSHLDIRDQQDHRDGDIRHLSDTNGSRRSSPWQQDEEHIQQQQQHRNLPQGGNSNGTDHLSQKGQSRSLTSPLRPFAQPQHSTQQDHASYSNSSNHHHNEKQQQAYSQSPSRAPASSSDLPPHHNQHHHQSRQHHHPQQDIALAPRVGSEALSHRRHHPHQYDDRTFAQSDHRTSSIEPIVDSDERHRHYQSQDPQQHNRHPPAPLDYSRGRPPSRLPGYQNQHQYQSQQRQQRDDYAPQQPLLYPQYPEHDSHRPQKTVGLGLRTDWSPTEDDRPDRHNDHPSNLRNGQPSEGRLPSSDRLQLGLHSLPQSDELHNRDREQPPDQGIHSRFAGSPSGRQQQNQHAPSPLTPSSSGDNNAGSKGGTYWSTHTEEESLGDKNYRPSSHFDKTDAKNYNSHTSDYDRMPSEASNNNNNNNNNKANWRSKSLSKEELQSRFGTDMPKTVDLKSAIETCDLLCQFALHYGGREPSRATPAESVRGQFGENGAGGIPTIDPNDRAVLQNIRNLAGTMLVGVQNNLSGGDGSPTEAPSNNSNETLNSNQLPESKSPSGDKDRDEGRGPTEAPQFGPGPPSNEMVHELAKAATSIFQLAIRIKAWVNMTADERELDEEINIIRGKRCLFMDDMSPFPMPTAMTTTMTLDTVRGTGRSSGGGRSSYSNYNQGQPPGGGGGGANSGEYARQHPHQDYFPYYQHGTKRHNNYRNDMDDPYSYTHSHPHGPSSSNHGHPGGGIQSYADGYGDGMMTPKSGSEKGSENTPHQKYRKRAKRTHPLGRCLSCDTTDTPEWRRGPDGARTLCNACGLHYAKLVKRQKQLQQQQLQEQEHQQLQPTSTSSSSAANMPGHHDLPSNIGTVTTLMIRNDMNNRVTPMRLQPPTPIRPMDYTATEEPHSVLRSGSLDSEQEMTTEAAIGSGIDEDTIMTR